MISVRCLEIVFLVGDAVWARVCVSHGVTYTVGSMKNTWITTIQLIFFVFICVFFFLFCSILCACVVMAISMGFNKSSPSCASVCVCALASLFGRFVRFFAFVSEFYPFNFQFLHIFFHRYRSIFILDADCCSFQSNNSQALNERFPHRNSKWPTDSNRWTSRLLKRSIALSNKKKKRKKNVCRNWKIKRETRFERTNDVQSRSQRRTLNDVERNRIDGKKKQRRTPWWRWREEHFFFWYVQCGNGIIVISMGTCVCVCVCVAKSVFRIRHNSHADWSGKNERYCRLHSVSHCVTVPISIFHLNKYTLFGRIESSGARTECRPQIHTHLVTALYVYSI